MEKVISASATTSAGVGTEVMVVVVRLEIADLRASVLSERFQTMRLGKDLARLAAIGRPMTPRPMNPILTSEGVDWGVRQRKRGERVGREGEGVRRRR